MPTDEWPKPPFRSKDYPLLLELMGREEFERIVLGKTPAIPDQGFTPPPARTPDLARSRRGSP